MLNLVHTVLVNYTETGSMSTGLSYLRGTADGYMDEVHALRNQYGADVVVLINTDTDTCGVAYVMRTVSTSFASSAFAAVRDGCLTAGTFAHEIGHIQGNMHDPESSSSAGAYPDSYGHRVCGTFRDIMSYSCSGEPRINYFSNPDVTYQTWPTGILGERDTARSMGVTAATVASFRSAVSAPTLPTAPSSLQATLASSDSIDLTWSDNASDEVGYKVQGSMDGSSWDEIAALGPNVTRFTDTGLVAGQTYSYRVYAFNSVGSSAFSNTASATLSVAQPDTVEPTVTIKSPADGASVSGTVNISAVATDNVAVTGMKIFLNKTLLGTSSTGTLSVSWNTRKVAKGQYEIRAEATDAAGNSGTHSIKVWIGPVQQTTTDTSPPSVQILTPVDGAVVSGNAAIQVSATDDVGVTTTKVYIGNTLLATSSSGSLSTSWNTRKAASGTHVIRAESTDAAGNLGTVSITVTKE